MHIRSISTLPQPASSPISTLISYIEVIQSIARAGQIISAIKSYLNRDDA